MQQAGGRFVALVVFLALARLLGPVDFGLVALATVFIGFMQVLVEGGFGQAIIQRTDLRREHADSVFWVSISVAIALGLTLALASGPLSELLHEPRLAGVLLVLSPAMLISSLGVVQSALLRRSLRFRPLAVRAVASNAGAGVIGLSAAFLGLGVWALVLQYLTLCAMQTLMLWCSTSWRPRLRISSKAFHDIFAFSRNSLGSQSLILVNQRSDDFMIGASLGAVPLGIYSVAYRLIRVMTEVVNQMLANVALPVFSRVQDDVSRLARIYQTVLSLCAAVSFPAYMYFVVAAPDVVQVLFGEQWASAAPIMQILSLYGALQATLDITDACLNAIGRPHIVFRNGLLGTLVLIASFAVAVQFGLTWVAIALVVRTYLMAPLPIWSLRRAGVINFRAWLSCFVTPVLATALMLAAMYGIRILLIDVTAWVRLLVVTPSAGVVYFLALWVIDRRLFKTLVGVVRRRSSEALPVKSVSMSVDPLAQHRSEGKKR